MPYLILMFAVLAETIGTTALQASQQFSRPLPSVIVVVAYGAAFYLLAIALKTFPVGIAYAMWSGMGIVFIAIIGFAGLRSETGYGGHSGHRPDHDGNRGDQPLFRHRHALKNAHPREGARFSALRKAADVRSGSCPGETLCPR